MNVIVVKFLMLCAKFQCFTFNLGLMFDEIMFLYSYSIGPANSSVGRASDCSSEGRRFKPGLADVKPR